MSVREEIKRHNHWMIGIDDGYFPYYYKDKRGYTPLVAVLGRGPVIRDVSVRMILVDEDRPDDLFIELVLELVKRSPRERISSIATDNIIFAGFSVYDPWLLSDRVGIPVIVVFSHDLNLKRIKVALERHFKDHEYRYSLIERAYSGSSVIRTPRGILRILCVGAEMNYCANEILYNQTSHKIPQPLKSADIIASALGRFLSNNTSSI
ncbi:MAG: DUF99 family protein [Sulfolobales archaeon]